MSGPTKCPSSAELHELLEASAADSHVIAHLDNCRGCQVALEELADSDGSLCKTLREQKALEAPPANSAYWPAVQHAEDLPTLLSPGSARSGEFSLDFLSPSEDGEHLGRLSHFNIVRVVGRGGMGVVLHAEDTFLQRNVAVKVLDPELAKDEMARQRFCREARAAASITHENVVAVHQVEHEEGSDLPFLVMELVSGESLESKLQRDGRLPLKEIVRIGMQAAAGLAAAHEKGLIHRDIKPGNILLEQSGLRVKLTDFGLARLAEDVRLTSTGLVAGTPLYMSPEQARGDELDARSDLFSLGVVLYELAAGEPPFNGKTPLVVLKKLTDEKHQPLRERNPELPEWFTHVVDRLLAKKPEDRYQTASELADTFDHFWTYLKTSSDTLPTVCAKKKARQFWKAVALGTAAGLGTLLVGIAAFLAFMPHSERGEDPVRPATHVYKGNAGPLWSLALSTDGKKLAMGTNQGTVEFWDVDKESIEWTKPAHNGTVWAIALSPHHFATASDDGPAKIWDLHTQKEGPPLADSVSTRSLAFDAEGKRLLGGGRKGSVNVWELPSGKLRTLGGHTSLVGSVAFSKDGKTLASASNDKTIKIWDADSGQQKMMLEGHQAGVFGIAFSPDGRMLVSGGWDKTVRLWDLNSASQIAKLPGPTQDIWTVDFSPNGKFVAAAGEDQMVRIWDVATKKEVAAFRGSTGSVLSMRFLPENGFIIASGKDGDARLWNLPNLNTSGAAN